MKTQWIAVFLLVFSPLCFLNAASKKEVPFPKTDPATIGLLYQILKVADIELTDHGIPYWLDFGTLLEALRHQGIIPWDDDVDISLMIEDREALRALAPVFAAYGLHLYGNGDPNNQDLFRLCRFGAPFPWVDIFIQEMRPNRDIRPIGRVTSWFPKAVWYEDEVTIQEKVPFGPLMLSVCATGNLRHLCALYGNDCMETAYLWNMHSGGNQQVKVSLYDFSPAEYVSDGSIIDLP